MSWLPKMDKDDFVGKFALEHFAQREEKEKLVGFTMEEDVLPAEGAQIVIEGLPAGRVTSARRSEAVGQVIGLAWVPTDRSQPGTRVEIAGRSAAARGAYHARRVLRPVRGADALVSRAFLSPSRCAEGTVDVAASARARGRRSRRSYATSRSRASSRFAGTSTP